MPITTTDRPSNLAQLKRALRPGDVLIVVWYALRERMGRPQTPLRLTIEAINTAGIIFVPTADIPGSWASWKPAKRYEFTERGFVVYDNDGSRLAEYHYA